MPKLKNPVDVRKGDVVNFLNRRDDLIRAEVIDVIQLEDFCLCVCYRKSFNDVVVWHSDECFAENVQIHFWFIERKMDNGEIKVINKIDLKEIFG